MNFTKEYIKECDCPEIQGLRNEFWEYGDYASINGSEPYLVITETGQAPTNGDEIFIPTGDQLTDLIFKHCHTYNLDITLYHEHHCRDCGKYCIAMEANNANGHLIEKEIDIEAREYEIKLAKIKLLKELLNE